MNIGTIQGGTRAGWRRVKQAHKPWYCFCETGYLRYCFGDPLPGWKTVCDDCGDRRP